MSSFLDERAIILMHMANYLGIFACPACKGDLIINDNLIACASCQNTYQIEDGIPFLFVTNEGRNTNKDVTELVKSFYEQSPFPNYDGLETAADLMQKAQKGVFARLLNEQVPFDIRVLEVGCGTGQLSNFLGIAHRTVFGADMCLNSLKLAQEFKKRNGLERVGFYQMNLFRPIFKEESFPLVICNGVLHHTSDPFGGFLSIAKLVKKGGYIAIGLYHRHGRVINDIRRTIFKLSGDRFKSLDPRLRASDIGDTKKKSWFNDQYKNPHESKHTFKEVLQWFDSTGFTFVNSIPKLKAYETFSEQEKLFSPQPRGNWFDEFLLNTRLLMTGDQEGGFFLMIGKKNIL